MNFSVKHGLPNRGRVRAVVDNAYGAYQDRLAEYNPSMQWLSDSQAKIEFTVMSKSLVADITIDDDDLTINGDVPLLFRPFQKRITSVLSNEVEKWLAKARAGEI